MAKALLASGKLGALYQIDMNIMRYTRRNDWQAQKKFGGGMLNNYGAHFLDLLMHLTSFDAEVCYADMRCVASVGDADDVVRTTVKTADGVALKANSGPGNNRDAHHKPNRQTADDQPSHHGHSGG